MFFYLIFTDRIFRPIGKEAHICNIHAISNDEYLVVSFKISKLSLYLKNTLYLFGWFSTSGGSFSWTKHSKQNCCWKMRFPRNKIFLIFPISTTFHDFATFLIKRTLSTNSKLCYFVIGLTNCCCHCDVFSCGQRMPCGDQQQTNRVHIETMIWMERKSTNWTIRVSSWCGIHK